MSNSGIARSTPFRKMTSPEHDPRGNASQQVPKSPILDWRAQLTKRGKSQKRQDLPRPHEQRRATKQAERFKRRITRTRSIVALKQKRCELKGSSLCASCVLVFRLKQCNPVERCNLHRMTKMSRRWGSDKSIRRQGCGTLGATGSQQKSLCNISVDYLVGKVGASVCSVPHPPTFLCTSLDAHCLLGPTMCVRRKGTAVFAQQLGRPVI